jgi:hypothetical protein
MKFLIRCATADDVEYIGEHMTEEARREIRKTGEDPAGAVRFSARNSDLCSILEMDGTPIMIYGVYASLLGTSKIWAIGTDACKKCPLFMVKVGRDVVRIYRYMFGKLENWCDEDYASSIKWLRMIGFEVDPPKDGFCHLHIGG